MRPLLVACIALALVPDGPAWGACAGAFLSAAAVAECLGPPAALPPSHTRQLDLGRNVAVTPPTEPAPPAAINLWVNFAFDSAELTTDARLALDEVATALTYDRLRASRFVVAGHTDGVGRAEYNQDLSLRRANAVRDYLMERGPVDGGRLSVEGWGFSRPLNPADPTAAENRRVEIRAAASP